MRDAHQDEARAGGRIYSLPMISQSKAGKTSSDVIRHDKILTGHLLRVCLFSLILDF